MDVTESQHRVKADTEMIRCNLTLERIPRTITTKGLRQTPLKVQLSGRIRAANRVVPRKLSSLRHLMPQGLFYLVKKERMIKMKKINLTDVTLRENSIGHENSLSFKEIIETAKILDKLNLDTIYIAPILDEKVDTLLVRTITSVVKNSALSIPVGMTKESVEIAWKAVCNATRPRLCVELPVSTVQMEFSSNMKSSDVMELISTLVCQSKKFCDDVEFAAMDATRSEKDFLVKALETAISAGASIVTLCDTAGTMLPHEMEEFIKCLYEDIPSLKNVILAVRCSDELSMATACAATAIRAGATEIDVAINAGIAPSIKEIALLIKTRGDDSGYSFGIKTTNLHRSINQINWLTRSKSEKNSPFQTGIKKTPTKDIKLDAKDDISTVEKFIKKLGYDLSDEDLSKVYETFIGLAEKKTVGTKELEAIIASTAMQVPPTYKLVSFVINSGNTINATANIHFKKNEEDLFGLAIGDGPIDASFFAIEQITGQHYELDDFQIQAITEGREAMGSSLVKLRFNGKIYSGNGISTDIIGSSIRAYLNALNKIVFEENQKS